ncbi:nose resistant to fluoxetine protein 6-like [Anoplophora glabripennis]|uniref:nose resistant to fluoxetine protein 6-like n=1 Tax=Anoplophora glabripennis TaxID=217634 RepID=UPI000C75B9AE|nr:nose resistant to fluoxetine protein 6-like [Anoplophora glabripennis]
MRLNYKDISKQPRNIAKLGWCIPASCSPSELEKYLNENLNHSLGEGNVTYSSRVLKDLCRTSNEGRSLDSVDLAFCITVLVLTILVTASTFWDFKCHGHQNRETISQKLFMAFSARKNFLDLNKLESSDKALSILYGIKTFSIFMIIIDHRFAYFIMSIVSNVDYIEGMYRNPLVSYIFHGDLFVDTFFVISGVLVVYSLMGVYDKKIINPGLIIFMRYIRLTPAYAFVIFYYCSLLYHSGDGPLWKSIVGPECMVHSWYLPCDFHFFVLAVGLVLLMKKQKKLGISVFFTLAIVSVLIPFGLKYIYKRPAFFRFFPTKMLNVKADKDFTLTYTKSHARATTYFIGMFAGYLYYQLKGVEYKISRLYSTILALISSFLLLACMFAGSVYYDPFHTYNG